MRFLSILCLASAFIFAGCETREQTMQKREGDRTAGSIEAAAYMAELENVRRLISEGADVNVTLKDGGTPLFSAVARVITDKNDARLIAQRRQVVKLLLEAGANPNAQKDGRTVTETAARAGDPEINQMLYAATKSL